MKLLGHRYYDSRTGRFISQDPAGDGDNWYAYAGNDPTDGADPDGLSMQMPPTGETMAHEAMMGFLGGLSFGGSGMGGGFTKTDYTYTRTRPVEQGTGIIGPWGPWEETDAQSTTFDMGGSAMFAGDLRPGPKGSAYREDMGESPKPDLHIYHKGDPHGDETNIDHEGKLRTGVHRGRELKELPNKLKDPYRGIISNFLKKYGMGADAIGAALEGLVGDIPIFYYDPKMGNAYMNRRSGG